MLQLNSKPISTSALKRAAQRWEKMFISSEQLLLYNFQFYSCVVDFPPLLHTMALLSWLFAFCCLLSWKFSSRWYGVFLGFNHIWSETLSFLPENFRFSFALCPLFCPLTVTVFVGFFQARAQSSLEKRNVLDRLLYYFNLADTRPAGCRRNQRTKPWIFQRLHLFFVISYTTSHFTTSEVLQLFLVRTLVAEHFA